MSRTLVLVSIGALAGCVASPTELDEVPSADGDGLTAQQLITNTNADGTWTANAHGPYNQNPPNTWGGATFTGPAGKTRKMGVCLVKRAGSIINPITCTTPTTCPAPPTGGNNYCLAPNGVGQKYCFARGPAKQYCIGTPVDGLLIAPGIYHTPTLTQGTVGNWMSTACIEACANTDPSSSSVVVNIPSK